MTQKEKKEDVVGNGVAPKLILGFACLAICLLLASPASAATVTIGPAECAALNGFDIVISPTTSVGPGHIVIGANDDVRVTCLLEGKSVLIRAVSITVDNSGFPNVGAIHTVNKEGMKLNAGLDGTSLTKCGNAAIPNSPPNPNAQIHILGATLQDDNSNGGVRLTSCGSIDITAGSSLTSKGANVQATCLFPALAAPQPPNWCTVTAASSTFYGNRVELDAQGNVVMLNDSVTTIGPRDRQIFISYFGSVLAGGCLSALTNGPSCPPGQIPIEQACQFCQECGHSSFFGGVEGSFFAYGMQEVDLAGACIAIGENITITAIGRSPIAPYTPTGGGVGPGNAFYVNLQDAEIRDDFGKTGYISVTALPPLKNGKPYKDDDVPLFPGGYPCSATWSGSGAIWYDNAVLIDDGANGGGVDPQAVAFMNGCRAAQPGNCGPVTLNCNPAPIPARGFVADPGVGNGRTGKNVSGVPRCDS